MAKVNNNKHKKKNANIKPMKNYIQDLENKSGKRWYEQVPLFECDNIAVELNQEDLVNLNKEAKKAFDAEVNKRKSTASSEQGWLLTAASKGTSRDRANAGAVLVESDPIRNLQALNSLVALCKAANKECLEIIDTLTELFISTLLPSDRKLIPLSGRGAEYKVLKSSTEINPVVKNKILSFWQFEADLKETFIVFYRNLQSSVGIGLEVVKCRIVSCAARLLAAVPEQEQNLLTLLINKLGDPCHKVASKSIYHLSNISHTHPNMSTIIVKETEKFLFRNNLPKKAQHYALCFLGNLGGNVESDVAERLVRICFAFFKGCVNTGEIDSRTMSTILSCVRRAIAQVEKKAGDGPVLTEDLQNTMYRLIHTAEIKVSLQALGLLIQVEQGSDIYSDRFYTALYKRMVDPKLGNVSHETMSLALHILYKAISLDPLQCRAMAFVKRFLQITLYFPVHFICACLYVISKILVDRKDDKKIIIENIVKEEEEEPKLTNGIILNDSEVTQTKDWLLDDTADERYDDVLLDENDKPTIQKAPTAKSGSWYHAKPIENVEIKIEDEDNKDNVFKKPVKKNEVTSYDPYHRNPSFAGAQFVLNHELFQLKDHYHPTVQLFADLIIEGKPVEYTGDPLLDFSAAKFLERFSFKNPKKMEQTNIVFKNKYYVRAGARNKSVYNLNDKNVTEEERFIFEYLERRREKGYKMQKKKENDEDSDVESVTSSVEDDEFDAYLDGLSKDKNDLDFMEEVGDKLKSNKKSKKNEDSESDSDLGDDDVEDFDENELSEGEDDDDIEAGSDEENVDNFSDLGSEGDDELIGDLDDDAEDMQFSDDGEDIQFSDDDEMEEKVNIKNKRKKRKGEDLESLFADADDFAHLLEEAGQSKQKQGSSSAVFNRDKSSDKQLKWEEKRRQGSHTYKGKKFKKRH